MQFFWLFIAFGTYPFVLLAIIYPCSFHHWRAYLSERNIVNVFFLVFLMSVECLYTASWLERKAISPDHVSGDPFGRIITFLNETKCVQ